MSDDSDSNAGFPEDEFIGGFQTYSARARRDDDRFAIPQDIGTGLNPEMFTLEESALLSRMLRFLGWALVCIALGIAAYFVLT